MLRLIILILIFFTFLGCKKNINTNFESKFVINGYIESGGYAYVTITRNIPFNEVISSEQLEKIVVRYAKVTVTDGEETEILTGYYDKNNFPYFYYKGNSLIGKPGKKYDLEVNYSGYILKAETEIPTIASINNLWFDLKDNNKMQLNINFTDNINEKNFYKIYTKTSTENDYMRCLASNHDDKFFNGKTINLKLNRGKSSNTSLKWDPYFELGDTVTLRFSTINKQSFDFWQAYENEIVNASNPLMGSSITPKGNIVGRATGVWCGYGVNYYKTVAQLKK